MQLPLSLNLTPKCLVTATVGSIKEEAMLDSSGTKPTEAMVKEIACFLCGDACLNKKNICCNVFLFYDFISNPGIHIFSSPYDPYNHFTIQSW